MDNTEEMDRTQQVDWLRSLAADLASTNEGEASEIVEFYLEQLQAQGESMPSWFDWFDDKNFLVEAVRESL